MNKTMNNGTIKATNIPKIPASVFFFGKLLQFISPRLASRFAIRLFRTPIRFKTPERELIMAESAQNQMVHIPEINKEVSVYSYGYSKRKVLLVHGWSGRGTQLYQIADKLLENGFMTISFDAPAHGLSPGKFTMMTEFIAAVKVLEEKFGPFEVGIGHSLGGMAILNSIRQKVCFDKAVIIGSGDLISDIIKEFVAKLQLKPKIVGLMKRQFFKHFKEDIDHFSGSAAAQHVSIPTLVIHDTQDKDVPVHCAYQIRQNLQHGEILVTNGLGHRQILKDQEVIHRIAAFVK